MLVYQSVACMMKYDELLGNSQVSTNFGGGIFSFQRLWHLLLLHPFKSHNYFIAPSTPEKYKATFITYRFTAPYFPAPPMCGAENDRWGGRKPTHYDMFFPCNVACGTHQNTVEYVSWLTSSIWLLYVVVLFLAAPASHFYNFYSLDKLRGALFQQSSTLQWSFIRSVLWMRSVLPYPGVFLAPLHTLNKNT